MDFSSDLLVESRSAREQGIGKLKEQHSEEQVLNKVKQLFFAVWKNVGRVTRQQLADFYEVSIDSIDKNYQRHEDEFKLDRVEVLRGASLKDARDILSLASKSSQETIYTSAGALRMGFILRESEVAKTVRTIAIRFIQGVGSQVSSQLVLQNLTEKYPALASFSEKDSIKVSTPLSNFSEKERLALIKKHTRGYPYVLPKMPSSIGKDSGVTTDEIRERFQFLSTYVDNLTLKGDKELELQLGEKVRKMCPHMISNVFEFDTLSGIEKAVLMFQYNNVVIDFEYLQNCLGRKYIQVAKNYLGVDYAYLIFVAPLGANPDTQKYIEANLSSEDKGYVGVLTVKELADFLLKQSLSTRERGATIGKIKMHFEELLRDPFEIKQGNIFDFFGESPEVKRIT